MSKKELQEWLLKNPGFQERFQQIVIDSVASQFSGLYRKPEKKVHHDWSYLILCASLLAQSENGHNQDVALRIAQFCLEQTGINETYKDAAAVILDSLANQPAIILAQNRKYLLEDIQNRLPLSLMLDWNRRSIENTITLNDSRIISVNHFQKLFWKKAGKNNWLSISAPTSAGKSFILGQWIADFLRESKKSTVVYLVPTRALIYQVQHDIEHLISAEKLKDVLISTIPMRSLFNTGKTNILIFTQERFHIILGEFGSELSVDLLIVDEAQKIGDNYRGILLQQAIETAIFRNPRCHVIFASPMTTNPEILLEDAPNSIVREDIVREDIMVNQNLIWVSQQARKPQKWNVEILLSNEPVNIGQIELPNRPSPDSKRLPFVAFALGNRTGGNVLYANGAADAEKMAKQVFDLLSKEEMPVLHEDISNLIELVEKTIHKKYSLIKYLLPLVSGCFSLNLKGL